MMATNLDSAFFGLNGVKTVVKDTGRCASEEAKPRRGWTRGYVPTRTLGPEGGGFLDPISVGRRRKHSL